MTGAGGFVGSNLARRLLREGHSVHLVARPGGALWRLDGIAGHAHLHPCDLADAPAAEAVLRSIRPEWVFHLAAHGAYPFQTDPVEIARTNYLGTVSVLCAALKAGCQIVVNVGSSSEYGCKDHAPTEEEPPFPNSPYAATKAAATQYCAYFARSHGLPVPTLRLYSAYGPYEERSRLIPTLVRAALQRRLPPLAAPGIARDFLHVDDACSALMGMAAWPPADPGAVFNLGTGRQTTLRELVALATELFGIRDQPEWGSFAPRCWDTEVWRSDPTKLQTHLGWQPRIGLPSGLRAMADWLLSEPGRLQGYGAM